MRVLLVASGVPFPQDTGGKIRTVHTLRLLVQEHDVTLATLVPRGTSAQALAETREWVGRLVEVPWRESPKGTLRFYGELAANLASALPYVAAKRSSRRMRAVLSELEREGGFEALICDFLFAAVNTLHVNLRPRLLFQHNLETQIWERHVATARSGARRRYFALQQRRVASLERRVCSSYDRCIAVSDADAEAMRRDFGAREVSVVPTGVDLDYFAPARGGGSGIVFVGSMDWMPNQDAVRHFVAEVLPLVRREEPDVRFKVVGRSPPPDITRMAKALPGVQVTGFVEDVRPHLAAADVVVIPLRVAGGTRIKAYEAMAMGKAVVSTSIGVEGLPLRAGRECLVADAPVDFARQVLDVLRRSELRGRLGDNARAFVVDNCSWERAARRFLEIVEAAAAARRSTKAPTHAVLLSH